MKHAINKHYQKRGIHEQIELMRRHTNVCASASASASASIYVCAEESPELCALTSNIIPNTGLSELCLCAIQVSQSSFPSPVCVVL